MAPADSHRLIDISDKCQKQDVLRTAKLWPAILAIAIAVFDVAKNVGAVWTAMLDGQLPCGLNQFAKV